MGNRARWKAVQGRLAAWAGLCVLTVLTTGACSSDAVLESRNVGPHQTRPVAGVSYYLPKKLLHVEVWRYVALVDKLDAKGEPIVNARGEVEVKPEIRHFALHAKDGSDDLVIPDHRHQFVINPKWDVASDDHIEVRITPEGFLREVFGQASDQRAEIASGLTDLFSMLVTGDGAQSKWGGPARAVPHRGLMDDRAQTPRFIAELEFDPVDPVDHARAAKALKKYGIEMTLTKQPDCPTANSGAGCAQTCDCTAPGIYYRLPIPYRLTLQPAGLFRPAGALGARQGGEWEALDGGLERTVLLPNEAVCLYVPASRAKFVTGFTSMRFDRGMLTEVVTDKPSELLGFVRIPVDAASAILAIPAELLTVRIKRLEQKTDAAALQEAQVNAERMKIESQIDLMDAARRLKIQAGEPEQPKNGWK